MILREGATWLRLGGLFQLTILVMHMCAGKRAATQPVAQWPWRTEAPRLFHFKEAESHAQAFNVGGFGLGHIKRRIRNGSSEHDLSVLCIAGKWDNGGGFSRLFASYRTKG